MKLPLRPVRISSAACILAVLFPVSGLAAGAGSAGASFLKFSPSPRGTGMGEAYTSISEDAYSAWWNPAGLASVERPEAGATYNASLQEISHQYISVVYPLRYGSTLGVNLSRLSVPAFQAYDAQGVKAGNIDASDTAVGAAYGRALYKDEIERPVFSVGAGVKVISERLANASANTLALDLGAVYYIRPAEYWATKAPAQEFRLGLAVKNAGPDLKFDKLSFPLPMSATLGGAWLSHPEGSASLILSLDQTISRDERYFASFGIEYVAFQLLAVRAGYRSGQDIGSGIRFGVGFRLSMLDIDYSFSPFGELGNMHKLGLCAKLGAAKAAQPLAGETSRAVRAKLIAPKPKIEKLQLFAQDFLALARKDIDARRYVSAMDNMKNAFNLEPELKAGEWGTKAKRLGALVDGLKLREIPEREKNFSPGTEQADAGAASVLAYINAQDLKSFLLAHAAYGANIRGADLFEEMLYLISSLVKISVRRDEILPRTALIKEKLRKAARSFYSQQFDAAAKECEEASLLDEANPVAWTRLGSAYFMMGDKAKAKAAYLRALELAPDDRVTGKFVEMQGWK